jgi:hypothetical protein
MDRLIKQMNTIINVTIRRRAALGGSISVLNNRVASEFATLPGFWAPGKGISDAKFESDVGATLDLRNCMADGIKGQVSYAARLPCYISDNAKADDFVWLRLNPAKADYKLFAAQMLPALIEIFQAYRAALRDERVRLVDWEIVRSKSQKTGRDIDGCDGVFRIWPVNLFDDILCRRSFGVGAEEVVRRTSPICEHAAVLNGGAFLLVTSELVVGGDALDKLDVRMKSRLTQ